MQLAGSLQISRLDEQGIGCRPEASVRLHLRYVEQLTETLHIEKSTLTGLVDCDAFYHNPVHFPARWHDAEFNGVIPKGTPVAQCLPVKRESWSGRFEVLSDDDAAQLLDSRAEILCGNDVYRHKYLAGKR